MRSPGMLALRWIGLIAMAVLPASRAHAQEPPSAMLALESLLNTHVSTAAKYDMRYSDPGSLEHLQVSIQQNRRTFITRLTSRI